MKHIYWLLLILFLTACHDSPTNHPDGQRAIHVQIAHAITRKTAQKIESETGLRLIGTGGGMMNHVRLMTMSFSCFGEISVDRARELLLYCASEYLSAINASEEIRPYLIHYPFTLKDIEILIFIRQQDRREVPIGSLAVATLINDMLEYKAEQQEASSFKKIHKETYQEALQLLHERSPATPL